MINPGECAVCFVLRRAPEVDDPQRLALIVSLWTLDACASLGLDVVCGALCATHRELYERLRKV